MIAWKDSLKRKIEDRSARVHVIGLGYVGLSLAVELARAGFTVRGIDVDLDQLYVKSALANDGPRMKRIRPAPMGRAFRYAVSYTHLTLPTKA